MTWIPCFIALCSIFLAFERGISANEPKKTESLRKKPNEKLRDVETKDMVSKLLCLHLLAAATPIHHNKQHARAPNVFPNEEGKQGKENKPKGKERRVHTRKNLA